MEEITGGKVGGSYRVFPGRVNPKKGEAEKGRDREPRKGVREEMEAGNSFAGKRAPTISAD